MGINICNFQGSDELIFFRLSFHRLLDTTFFYTSTSILLFYFIKIIILYHRLFEKTLSSFRYPNSIFAVIVDNTILIVTRSAHIIIISHVLQLILLAHALGMDPAKKIIAE